MQADGDFAKKKRDPKSVASGGDANEEESDGFFEVNSLLPEKIEGLMSADENVVLDSLDWLEDSLDRYDVILPDECLGQLLKLSGSSVGSISRQAMFVISQTVAFPSVMTTFLIENDLLSIVNAKFPGDSTVTISLNLVWNSQQTRDLMLENGVLERIDSLFGDDQDVRELAEFCQGVVRWPLEFEPFGPKIFELFRRLMGLFDPDSLSHACMIAKAFDYLVYANPNFLCATMVTGLVSVFLRCEISDSEFRTEVMNIASCIWNSEFEHFHGPLLQLGLIQYANDSIDEDAPNMSATAVNLLADVVLDIPQLIEKLTDDGIAETVIDMFASQSSALFKRAAVHFLIVMLAMASEKTFQELYSLRAFPVILQALELVEESEFDWTLRIFIRAIRDESNPHTKHYRTMLLSYPFLSEWLAAIQASTTPTLAEKAGNLLLWMSANQYHEQ